MESKITQIKSELTKLLDKWTKSAKSKMSTAKRLYPIQDGQLESWEHKSLNFTAICELNCVRNLQDVLEQIQ